jgi:type II secretory pathway pseudopilin PulG
VTTSRRQSRRPVAFALVELLVLLGILGLLALAGGRLFESTIRLGHASATAANSAASFDAMSAVLRRDAWAAAEVSISDDKQTATLAPRGAEAGADARPIVWTIKPDSITRDDGTPGAGPRGWPLPAPATTFALDGATLVLQLPATKTFAGGELRVTSQLMLLARRPQ